MPPSIHNLSFMNVGPTWPGAEELAAQAMLIGTLSAFDKTIRCPEKQSIAVVNIPSEGQAEAVSSFFTTL